MSSSATSTVLRDDRTILDSLIDDLLRDSDHALELTELSASVAFLTTQGAHHSGRTTRYVNTVLSVRVGAAVGSCAVEPGELPADLVAELTGTPLGRLLTHPLQAVRVATLDAYLAHRTAHAADSRSSSLRVPSGSSLEKSLFRAGAVVDLLPVHQPSTIAVIGVVNSVLATLRERGHRYLPCDFKGGHTEWDEPIEPDCTTAIAAADAVLCSGMVLGNGSFDPIARHCRDRGVPLVIFAQTGAAIFRELLGSHVTALSAEPYPFFWLTGDANDIHLYSAGAHE